MKLFVAIYNDAQLLGHFLAHYYKAGIKEFFIAVHPAFRDEVSPFEELYDITVFSDLDVTDTPIGQVSAVTEMRRRFQSNSEWAIIVDLDEFIEFPCNVYTLIREAELEEANVIRGIMWDRFSSDGRLSAFGPHSDLQRIYPVRARFIRDVMQGADYKSVLVKGFLKSASAHHIFYGEVISSKTLDISHYKWFAGSIDRLKAAHELVIKAGEAWAIEYQRVLDHYDKHGRFAWEKFGGELIGANAAEARIPPSRLRIIVLGFLIREPTGGQAWHYLNYVHGLAALGHDVYYIEDSDDVPMCFGTDLTGPTSDASAGLRFASAAFERLGLGGRWSYYDAHRNEWRGPRAGEALGICRSADLVLNVSGVNPIRDWLSTVPVRAMIDTDPGFTQIHNLTDLGRRARCAAHTAFFSFGENIGKPFCTVPDDGFPWQPTRQPVSLDAWPSDIPGPQDGKFTTVMQWESFAVPPRFGNLSLAMKSAALPPFMHLPNSMGNIFELAVRARPEAISGLRSAGWAIADIDAVCRDPWSFRSFVRRSKGEFGLAKQGYVDTRCGWFSERSVGYLASGRPVLHHDTGFTEWLNCGKGVIPFQSADDVIQAIARLDQDYDSHCRTARDIAREFFAAPRVLPPLIDAAIAGSKQLP